MPSKKVVKPATLKSCSVTALHGATCDYVGIWPTTRQTTIDCISISQAPFWETCDCWTHIRSDPASFDFFTNWGQPKTLVSINGSQFASAEFADWCRWNGIVHMTSVPFYAPSNGEAGPGALWECSRERCSVLWGERCGKRRGGKNIL